MSVVQVVVIICAIFGNLSLCPTELVGTLKNDVLFHEVLKAEKEKPTNGLAAQKHIQQQVQCVCVWNGRVDW